jgi:hypothetical protein
MDSTCVELAEAIVVGTSRLSMSMIFCAIVVSITMLYTEVWAV